MAAPRMCLILSENWTLTSGRDLPRLVRWARELRTPESTP